MDLFGMIPGFRNSNRIDGLPDAWHWYPAPGIDFAATLSSDQRHLLQLNARDSYDEGLAAAILAFAREHEGELLANVRPLNPVGGFSYPGSDFNAVASVAPGVHGHYAYDQPALIDVTHIVFPAYQCEFAGSENEEEAWTLYKRRLGTSRLDRPAVPWLKMRHNNPRTRSRSMGSGRGFAGLPVLFHEMAELKDTPDGFIEFENRHHDVWRATWDGTWHVTGGPGGQGPRETDLPGLRRFAEDSVRH